MPRTLIAVFPLVSGLIIGCSKDPPDESWSTSEEGSEGNDSSHGSESPGDDTSDEDASSDDRSADDTAADDTASAEDSGASGEGDTDTGSDTCGAVKFEFEPVTPLVMLVLDKSGSMMELWDDNGVQRTRWNTLHQVVSSMATTLDEKVEFGLELFPGAQACGVDPDVDAPAAPSNASAVIAAMPPADAVVAGGTPARAAHDDAVEHLTSRMTDQPKVIMLVTDGAANCVDGTNSYDHQFNDAVQTANADEGIPTYVIGIDIQDELDGGQGGSGVNLWDQLNDVSVKGGVPKMDPQNLDERFYNASDGAALQDAIDAISRQLETCVIDFDGEEPLEEDLVKVEVDGTVVDRVDDCETENGWVWVNPTGPYDAIELCGSACETLKETGVADIVFGCPDIQ